MRTLRSLAGALALAAAALPSAALGQGAPPPYPPPPPPPYAPPYGPPSTPPASGEHRSPWYVGFGIGSGNGSYVFGGNRVNYREHGAGSPFQIAGQIEAGATLTPHLLLGGELSGLVSTSSRAGIDYTLTVGQLLAVATWFPMERGLFLRGGAGLGFISADEDADYDYGYYGYGYGAHRSSSTAGGALLGGVGYAWWLGRRFNLTLHGDVNAHAYTGNRDAPSSSVTFTGFLGFRWY